MAFDIASADSTVYLNMQLINKWIEDDADADSTLRSISGRPEVTLFIQFNRYEIRGYETANPNMKKV
ncbi:hypothetical protein M8C21_028715 [Ambrosia artemisiifolia]|uniref:Uncharacterized protein n=1 Tax=Ambrosia artemisiifolia TaxID=4212 RepID=A0AAD5GA68_AMBAR|nr:hypothetical protein M8C21_028715 [Ambrosia artemisiifolia]